MSPPMVVLTGVVLLVLCRSSWGMTEPGLQELAALDEVLRDLQGVLEARRAPAGLVALTEPLAGVGNRSQHEGTNKRERLRGRFPPSAGGAAEPTGRRTRPSRRVKRVSPTPPPSGCPHIQLPDYLSKWEQLRYLVASLPSGCHHHGCCPRNPNPCPHRPEVLVARLAMLEEQVREVDRLEARLKIHIALIHSIQASPKYPGEPGEPGPSGRKGQEGFKGLPGQPGSPGSCRITGQANPSAGPPGPPGNKGQPGLPGDKVCGCNGDKGDPGPPGASRRGPPGPRGLKGQKGERGRDFPIFHG